MARRKKKQRRKARSDSAATAAQPRETPVASATDAATCLASRGRLVLAVSVFAAWGIFLVALALLTANPATLNRAQIEQADVVVTGRIINAHRGIVDVEQTWKSRGERNQITGKQITVRNLAETAARTGSRFLLPLSPMADGVYEITQPHLPGQSSNRPPANQPRRIYPVTDDVLAQLQEILKQ